METMEIEGTPSESQAPEGGDEEGGLEEATAETLAKENLPLENLDEFSVPTYSPQELMNRKDFSEMGVEESRAIARAILLIATKIATQISRRKKIGAQGQHGGSALDHAPEHEIRRRDHRPGASQAAHQKNQSRAALRRQRLDGLLQPIFDSVHVWPAERIVGRGDVCFQHLAQPDHAPDSHQRHRQRAGEDFRQHSRLVRRHQHRPLAAHFQPQFRAEHGDSSHRRRDHQRRLGPRRCELARTRDAGPEAALQENHLAQSASGERELRAAVQRHASGAAVSRFVFVGAQRQ